MTATTTGNIAAAPALAWVRPAWLAMADAAMAKLIGGVKETRRVAQADEAMLADVRAAAGGDGDAYQTNHRQVSELDRSPHDAIHARRADA